MKNLEEVKKLSDEYVKEYFKTFYNTTEFQQAIALDTDKLVKIKNQILNLLEDYNNDNYEINITLSGVEILKAVERTDSSTTYQKDFEIKNHNFKMLPYTWVMGHKVGKKIMQNTVECMV